MVWAAALIFLAELPTEGAMRTQPKENNWFWSATTTDGSTFMVMRESVLTYTDGSVTLWLNGDHKNSKLVAYRKSETRIKLSCRGTFSMQAITTTAANGSVIEAADAPPGIIVGGKGSDPWRERFIRPYTIYDDLARRYCQKQK